MGERKDNFKPMLSPSFESINGILGYFDNNLEYYTVYMEDSMSEADKIKVLTSCMMYLLYDYMSNVFSKNDVAKAGNTILHHIENIPVNSIDIMNAKNDFYIAYNIFKSFLAKDGVNPPT